MLSVGCSRSIRFLPFSPRSLCPNNNRNIRYKWKKEKKDSFNRAKMIEIKLIISDSWRKKGGKALGERLVEKISSDDARAIRELKPETANTPRKERSDSYHRVKCSHVLMAT